MELESNTRINVCLISSNNLDFHPNNTRTSFANNFSDNIRNKKEGESLFVRLQAIGLAIDWNQDTQPGYVKVQLWEVGEQLEGEGFNRLLAGFEHPVEGVHVPTGENSIGFTYKTFAYTPFLPLRYNSLNRFEILLTDVNNRPFRIEQGPPTVVLLEVIAESEMTDRGSFNITCQSRSNTTYPSNTYSFFKSPLPEMFDLKNYEVALLNVVFPNDLSENCMTYICVEEERYYLNLQDVASIEEWVFSMNRELSKGETAQELKFLPTHDAQSNQSRLVLQRERMPDGAHVGQKPFLHITMSWSLLKLLGETRSTNSLLMLAPGEKIQFTREPSLENVWPNPVALLMCDAVKSSLVGNSLKPLLSCVSVKHEAFQARNEENLKVRMYEPSHIHYVDVKDTPFNTISFEFLNPGEGMHRREFILNSGSDECVTVTLCFRPKKLTT